MPRARRPLLAPALSLLFAGACSDDAPADGGDASSSGDESPGPSTGDDPTDTSGPPADDSSTTASEDVTGSSGDTDTSSTTDPSDTSGTTGDTDGETQPPLELLVNALDDDGLYRFYHWRTTDEGTEGPTQIVPSDDAHWTSAELFADRRLVYRTQVGNSDHDLHLGDLDDPDSLVQLDVDPMTTGELGWIVPIADDALLIHAYDQDELYRIDFPGGVAQPPTLVAAADGSMFSADAVVDPTGRWVAVPVPSIAGEFDVSVARIDAPDPAGAIPVTALAPGEDAQPIAIDDVGENLFLQHAGGTSTSIEHVDLRADLPGRTTDVHTLTPTQYVQRYVPRSGGVGMSYEVRDLGQMPPRLEVWLARVDDGEPLPPVSLVGETESVGWQNWSPDGRWLDVDATIDGVVRQFLVRVVDGQEPVAFEVATDVELLVFSPDSAYAYLYTYVGGVSELARVDTSGDEPGDVEVVVQMTDRIVPGYPEDFTANGKTMLIGGGANDETSQMLVDVGGPLPAVPVVANGPLPAGMWAQFGQFSPDDAYVIYIERDGVFSPKRLMVADRSRPGTATAVMDAIGSWIAVPQAR